MNEYTFWEATQSEDGRIAWQAMQNTHKALHDAGMSYSVKALRVLAVEQFGEVCLEGLPLA